MQHSDILVIGTGYFAEIMICDIAVHAKRPVRVVIGGRNKERLSWLKEAGNARAANFGTEAIFETVLLDSSTPAIMGEGIAAVSPSVVVQSASMQSPWKVDRMDSAWSKLVADAGFGMTLAFHAVLPSRTSRALRDGAGATFVNTCYPDGVNQVLRAAGLPIACGVGNIGIFSSIITGLVSQPQRENIRVLGHHQHLVQWRKPGTERTGAPVRAWIGDDEIADVDAMTRHVQLPYRDLNVISGASAVPVLLALAGHGKINAHVPGPGGLPGGYPVTVEKGKTSLNLPKGISEQDAVTWNKSFEAADGVSVSTDGRVVYSEVAQRAIAAHSKELAAGFHVRDIEPAAKALGELRARLGG
ncbi:hypothetical protein V1282_001318 [Nitrobacteraceae bacterium AZCC 2146]